MSWDINAFREQLEAGHDFPGTYNFKFIVPSEKKDDILSVLPESEISFRESANGKYVSVKSNAHVKSSQEVLDVYLKAHKIPGCMSL